ncbi:hypothetical protein LEN26_021394 [Aphanomyces euteiches]|nr:hypothetical protein LEN26_021394 [Aphanomyces euteiches]
MATIVSIDGADVHEVLFQLAEAAYRSQKESMQALAFHWTLCLTFLFHFGALIRRVEPKMQSPRISTTNIGPQLNYCHSNQPKAPPVLLGYLGGSIAFGFVAAVYCAIVQPTKAAQMCLSYWAYSLTVTSILSSAAQGRTFNGIPSWCLVIMVSGITYPVVVWSVWLDGWFNPRSAQAIFGIGATDFGGSGALHVVAGTIVFVAALCGTPTGTNMSSSHATRPSMDAAGTVWLVLGLCGVLLNRVWISVPPTYQFPATINCVVNITLAGAGGSVVGLAQDFFISGVTQDTHNCIVSAVVAVSSVGPLAEPYAACIVGVTAALIYCLTTWSTWIQDVDRPLGYCITVHLIMGAWGVLASGVVGTRQGHWQVYSQADTCGLAYGCSDRGTLFASNLLYLVCLIVWTALSTYGAISIIRSLDPTTHYDVLGTIDFAIGDYEASDIRFYSADHSKRESSSEWASMSPLLDELIQYQKSTSPRTSWV